MRHSRGSVFRPFLRRPLATFLLAGSAVTLLHAQAPAPPRGTAGPPGPAAWVTAWGTSQQVLGEATISNASVRLIARVTVPGTAVRIRLDHGYGTEPVRIGRATVAQRIQGAMVAAGSTRSLTFEGRPEVTIPPGGAVWSDAVALPVMAQQDLAITLFVPGENVRPSQHTNAMVTSYRTANGAGDKTADESRTAFKETITATWWLKAVEVQSAVAGGAIVAFGDSITDGTCSTIDANDRWVNLLSVRLGLQHDAAAPSSSPSSSSSVSPASPASPASAGSPRARLKSVVNEGIGGNTVTRAVQPAPDSTPGVERLDRDVLSHHGVTDVIFFIGTNDLRREATVAQLTAGMTDIISRIRKAGPRVIGVTMIPRHNAAPNGTNTGWNAEKTARRREVNDWIRTRAGFDAVLDFDAVVRDPQGPDLIRADLNCGDGIHPSPAGYYALGRSISLSLFDPPAAVLSAPRP